MVVAAAHLDWAMAVALSTAGLAVAGWEMGWVVVWKEVAAVALAAAAWVAAAWTSAAGVNPAPMAPPAYLCLLLSQAGRPAACAPGSQQGWGAAEWVQRLDCRRHAE